MIKGIQPAETLGFDLKENHLDRVVIQVPLEGNLNDKKTMFAGSQFSGLVLSGWRLASNWAEDQGGHYPVVIKSTKMEFMKPVNGDLDCVASLEKKPTLAKSGNWKLKIKVEAKTSGGDVAAVLVGDYRVLVAAK